MSQDNSHRPWLRHPKAQHPDVCVDPSLGHASAAFESKFVGGVRQQCADFRPHGEDHVRPLLEYIS